MTEFNYLIYCPNCGTETNFLGGTASAVCLDCESVVADPMSHERLTMDRLRRERLNKFEGKKIILPDFDNDQRIARDDKEEEILSMLFGLKAEYDLQYSEASRNYKVTKIPFWKRTYAVALEKEDVINEAIETIMGIAKFQLDMMCV